MTSRIERRCDHRSFNTRRRCSKRGTIKQYRDIEDATHVGWVCKYHSRFYPELEVTP